MATATSLVVKVKAEVTKAALQMNKFKATSVKSVKAIQKSVVALNKSLGQVAAKIGTVNKRASNMSKNMAQKMQESSRAVSKMNAQLRKAEAQFKRLERAAAKANKRIRGSARAAKDGVGAVDDWTKRATHRNGGFISSVAKIRRAYYLLNFALLPVRKAVGGISAAFGVMTFAIIRSTNNIDMLAKKSRLLGVPVKNMQALAFAADLAGVNFQTLTMSMQRMTRRVSQAAGVAKDALEQELKFSIVPDLREREIKAAEQRLMELRKNYLNALGTEEALSLSIEVGQAERNLAELNRSFKETGEAAAAIRELGLDARELEKLSADKQFLKIAEALGKIQNKNDQIRIAQKIWDSEGVRNVLLLSDSLKENIALFEKLGAGLTGKQTAAVESFKDSMTRLATVIGSIFNKAVANLSPLLEKALDRMVDFVMSVGGIETIATSLARAMGRFIGFTVKGFGFLIDSAARFIAMMKKGALQIKSFFTSVIPTVLSGVFEGFQSKYISFLKSLNNIVNKIPGFKGSNIFKADISSAETDLRKQKAITEQAAAEGLRIQKQIEKIVPNQQLVEFGETLGEVGERIKRESDKLVGLQKATSPTAALPKESQQRIFNQGSSFSDKPIVIELRTDVSQTAAVLGGNPNFRTNVKEIAAQYTLDAARNDKL